MQQAKDELEEYCHTLLNNINQGVCLHEMIYKDGKPVDYRILEVNQSYARILNIPETKAQGSLASKLYEPEPPPYIDIFS